MEVNYYNRQLLCHPVPPSLTSSPLLPLSVPHLILTSSPPPSFSPSLTPSLFHFLLPHLLSPHLLPSSSPIPPHLLSLLISYPSSSPSLLISFPLSLLPSLPHIPPLSHLRPSSPNGHIKIQVMGTLFTLAVCNILLPTTAHPPLHSTRNNNIRNNNITLTRYQDHMRL